MYRPLAIIAVLMCVSSLAGYASAAGPAGSQFFAYGGSGDASNLDQIKSS